MRLTRSSQSAETGIGSRSRTMLPWNSCRAALLHQRFWDFVSGDTLEHVYRRVFAKVRAGESLNFSFRCDSPAVRRVLTLKMNPVDDGGIEFVTQTVSTEEREFQPLFDKDESRVGAVVVACSWCNKIKTVENIWQEPEDAVLELGLFEHDSLPPLSHGMCAACYASVMGKMDDRVHAKR